MRSRWRCRDRATAPAIRFPERHTASSIRSRNSPAGIRSAYCCRCRSPPPAPEPATGALSSAHGERNNRCDARMWSWMARPACLSPSNCAISRQIEPLAGFHGAVEQLGDQGSATADRRSMPATVIFVSRATPMRSAQEDLSCAGPPETDRISGRIGRKRRRGKLRRRYRRGIPRGRHGRAGSRGRPRFRRRYRSSACKTQNPR